MTTLELLTGHPFLAGLPAPWLEQLSFQAHPVLRHAGHRMFHEGYSANTFWLLRSGRVELDFHVAGQGDVMVERIEDGQVLGWSWLFPPYRWHFGAVAVEQVRAIEFNAPGVRRLMAEDAELGRELTTRFMSVVVDRLQATRVRLLAVYERHA